MDYMRLFFTVIEVGAWTILVLLSWFTVWKRMRMDHGENEVFGLLSWLTTIAIVTGFLAFKLSLGLLVPLWMTIVGIWVFSKKRGWDFWEWADGLGSLSLHLGMWGAVIKQHWVMSAGMLLGILIAVFIGKNYRNLWWYKSGKVGLVGLFSLGWWALVELAVVNLVGFRIYWVGFKPEVILIIVTLILTLAIIIVRSGTIWQKLTQKKH